MLVDAFLEQRGTVESDFRIKATTLWNPLNLFTFPRYFDIINKFNPFPP
jgi:hypothetical protein